MEFCQSQKQHLTAFQWRKVPDDCLKITREPFASENPVPVPLIIALLMAVKLRMKYEIRSSLITTVTNALSLSSTHSLVHSLKDVKWMPGVQKSNCLQRICKYPSVWSQLLWWLLRKQVRSNQLKSTGGPVSIRTWEQKEWNNFLRIGLACFLGQTLIYQKLYLEYWIQ